MSTSIRSQSSPSRGQWPRFLLFPLFAVLGYSGLILSWGGDHWTIKAGWVLILSFSWFCVAGSFHEAGHRTLFRSEWANILFGRLVGTFLVIPYTTFRETHRTHHAYMNTPKDYELWPYCDPQRSRWFRRCFAIVDLLFGVVTAPIIYGRIYWSKDSKLSQDVRRAIGLEYLLILLFWGGLFATLGMMTAQGMLDWSRFDPVWLLPLFISPIFNTVRKFTEHVGLESTDPVLGTRTVLGNNMFTRICSYFNFDIYIHGSHHRYPRLRHDELEQGMREIQSRAGQDQPLNIFPTYFAAIWDMLPCLWKGPGVGENAR